MKKLLICTLLLILSFQLVFNNTYTAYANINSSNGSISHFAVNLGTELTLASTAAPTNDTPKTVSALEKYLKSEGIVLVDADTGRILYQKNGYKKLYPASTTKIMTALLTIENVSLDAVVTVGKEATSVPSDSSLIYPRLAVGEKVTVRDLLYAMMFKSSNDAAEVLALYVGGTRAHFIEMMNEKAAELGMLNTHFTNPHGYQDANHYTTALDLARLAIYATKNTKLMSIVSSTTYTIPKTNKNNARVLKNVNKLLDKTVSEYFSYATGMKTGTTSDAQECLVSTASSTGHTVVAVSLKHPVNSTPTRFEEGKKLLQYGLYILNETKMNPVQFFTSNYIYPLTARLLALSPVITPTPAVTDTNTATATTTATTTPTSAPTMTASPTLTPSASASQVYSIDSTASASLGGFIALIDNIYSSLGIIFQLLITIVIIFIVLFLLLVLLRKKKAKRRKYRRKYMAAKARSSYNVTPPPKGSRPSATRKRRK